MKNPLGFGVRVSIWFCTLSEPPAHGGPIVAKDGAGIGRIRSLRPATDVYSKDPTPVVEDAERFHSGVTGHAPYSGGATH